MLRKRDITLKGRRLMVKATGGTWDKSVWSVDFSYLLTDWEQETPERVLESLARKWPHETHWYVPCPT